MTGPRPSFPLHCGRLVLVLLLLLLLVLLLHLVVLHLLWVHHVDAARGGELLLWLLHHSWSLLACCGGGEHRRARLHTSRSARKEGGQWCVPGICGGCWYICVGTPCGTPGGTGPAPGMLPIGRCTMPGRCGGICLRTCALVLVRRQIDQGMLALRLYLLVGHAWRDVHERRLGTLLSQRSACTAALDAHWRHPANELGALWHSHAGTRGLSLLWRLSARSSHDPAQVYRHAHGKP